MVEAEFVVFTHASSVKLTVLGHSQTPSSGRPTFVEASNICPPLTIPEVGEGGTRLSVGQKQLISFARALIANPKILILDEATSSVDTKTEKSIQRAIKIVLKGRTSFVIAHRLSTITSSDRILVLKDGKIIETGTHTELIKQEKHYHKLYTNQFKSKAIEKSKNE